MRDLNPRHPACKAGVWGPFGGFVRRFLCERLLVFMFMGCFAVNGPDEKDGNFVIIELRGNG